MVSLLDRRTDREGWPFGLNRRLVLGVALLALLLLPVLTFVGRWEARRQLAGQVSGIKQVLAAVGPLDSPTLESFRGPPGLRCLDYRRGTRLLALELCFDNRLRVVQASDRRGSAQRVYSVRLDPSARVPVLQRAAVERVLALQARRTAAH